MINESSALAALRTVVDAALSGAPAPALPRDVAPRLRAVPGPRQWTVWQRIADAPVPSRAVLALASAGLLDAYPALSGTRGVPQDPVWHPEGDVFTHSLLAADVAARLAERDGVDGADRHVAVLGALAHDFGKVTCTEVGDRVTAHGHAEAGVEPARGFLRQVGAPEDVVDRVTAVVGEHMAHASVKGSPSSRTVFRLKSRLWSASGCAASVEDWARVVTADCLGRGAGAKESPAPLWVDKARREDTLVPLLRGQHLIDAGLTPGPAFRVLLADATAAQARDEFDTEDGAIWWLSSILGAPGVTPHA